MISRHWTGLAKKDKAPEYLIHLKTDTFRQLKQLDGFISASILKRELDEGIEFLIITEWKTLDSIKQFAGDHYEKAVVPAIVQSMMIRYDAKATHYEVETTV
jgi:heme-degrading monooxygenase HmoA